MGSKQSMTAGEFSVGLLSGVAGSIITVTVQNIRDWLIQPRLKVDNVMGGRLETILLHYGGTLRSLAFKEKSPGGWGSARQGSRLPSPRVSTIVQWRQRSGPILLPFSKPCPSPPSPAGRRSASEPVHVHDQCNHRGDPIRECEGRDDSADLAPWDGVAEHDKLANVGRRHCDFLSG